MAERPSQICGRGAPPGDSGRHHRHQAGLGFLTIPELATGHHLRIDTYLAVPSEGRLAFPRFQFNNAGELWPGFSDVLTVFRNGVWDDVSTGLWFISHQSRLDAAIPALMICDHPSRVLSLARDIVDDW